MPEKNIPQVLALRYGMLGSERIGRQSQTWVRTQRGWKIVSAHVSFLS